MILKNINQEYKSYENDMFNRYEQLSEIGFDMQMKKEVQIIHIHSSITIYFTVLTTLTFTAV